MANPMTLSVLTLSDLKRSTSRSLGFQCLISRKGAKLGLMLLLIINRKPHVESNDIITFDLECSWKLKVKVTRILSERKFAWNRHSYQQQYYHFNLGVIKGSF